MAFYLRNNSSIASAHGVKHLGVLFSKDKLDRGLKIVSGAESLHTCRRVGSVTADVKYEWRVQAICGACFCMSLNALAHRETGFEPIISGA